VRQLTVRSDVMGHQLPRRLLVRAAAMAPITDTKADDWGVSRDEAFLIAVNIAKLPSVPRQILKDIPRPPNSASRDD
jgi:hypothetical protein